MARIPIADQDGVRFRDLNGNGRLDPFEDPRLAPEERADDLIGRLSTDEKIGLLFHPILGVGAPGDLDGTARPSRFSPREAVVGEGLNHFNLHALPSVVETVRWHNALQELAETTPHGIPITFSSDPRHGFLDNSGVSWAAGAVSQWPEPIGFAALGDPEAVQRFADVQRQEYLALGLRCALHPQADLATEPRWARQAQTFGQSAEVAAALTVAYLDGMQGGSALGASAVACTTKHFPGGGPQRDGEDPHFEYGREQVYPGGRFDEHLAPFVSAIAAGTSGIMPYYGMPVGLELDGEPVDEVGFAFNRRIVVDLLRGRLGFDGVLLTDFGLITDRTVFGKPFPARAWGVEALPPIDRLAALLDAGADQLGGEDRTDLLRELVASGRMTEERLDESVRRVLLVKFRLGLFDDPYLDEGASVAVVGADGFREAGHRAQAESVCVLDAGPEERPLLPLPPTVRLYVHGVDPDVAARYGSIADDPDEADVAVVRLAAPFEPRDDYFLEAAFHQGSLEFPAEVVERLRALAAEVPVVLDVFLDRPAILTPLLPFVSALVVDFGASDRALLDALTGRVAPRGRLPFDLPRSSVAVAAARSDVPGDTPDPLWRAGARVSTG